MFDIIIHDIKRFGNNNKITLRSFVRCLLSQGFSAILVYRFFNYLHNKKIPGQPFRFVAERIVEITTGISIPAECSIGKGFRIHHFGGIFFHPAVKIGTNCTIYQDVTLGDKGGFGGAPKLGNNVVVGAGAKILGGITIGDNSKIGALALVSVDIPQDSKVFCPEPIIITGEM